MNTDFFPHIESSTWYPKKDLPHRLSSRFQNVFTKTIENNERDLNYQTLNTLGKWAVLTGTVGIAASCYFQSYEYLLECTCNIALGVIAINRSSGR